MPGYIGRLSDYAFGMAWKSTLNGVCLVVGGKDKSVRVRKVFEDDGDVQLCLCWRSSPGTLVLSKLQSKECRA